MGARRPYNLEQKTIRCPRCRKRWTVYRWAGVENPSPAMHCCGFKLTEAGWLAAKDIADRPTENGESP